MSTDTVQNPITTTAGCGFVNGRFMPIAEASIPLLDWGFNKSDVVYDGIPFSAGRLFRLGDYLDRFADSMRKWRLEAPYSAEAIVAICHDLVAISGLKDGILYICTTRGVPPSAEVRDPTRFQNRMYGWSQEVPKLGTDDQLESGLRMIVSDVPRIPQASVDATAKNFHWGDLIQARLQAADRGAQNALLLSLDGCLAEGVGFNVFIFKAGEIATPARDCLEGMTRRAVLEIAADIGTPANIRDVRRQELDEAEEVFVSSSAGGVFAVTEIDGKPVGSGRYGQLTRRIHDEYWVRRHSDQWTTVVDYDARRFEGEVHS